MIRIAAVGDVHAGLDSRGRVAPGFADVDERADLLLLAGDLTRCGTPEETAVFADELAGLSIPKLAVLGNHDHHDGRPEAVAAVLVEREILVLEGNAAVVEVRGTRLGIAGVKGFGGGFAGASGSAFGEAEMKAFMHHTMDVCDRLEDALAGLDDVDLRVALLHYSPIPETLWGERLEIYPFLGSYLLAEAVDRAGAHLVFHGHAHAGTERGETPGGVPVRNVAQPVLGAAYGVYALPTDGSLAFHAAAAGVPRHIG
ncbi:MAG: metallophosphoesterase [Acidimicrobiia bacterium]|nr:metallophosphoesterase [Acidimicrobiia bacterium]